MSRPGIDLEGMQREAASELPARYVGDFQRLLRSIVFGPAFQWLLVDAPGEAPRRQIRSVLDRMLRVAGLRISQFPLSSRIPDVATLERRLIEHASNSDVIHVLAQRDWFDRSRWDAFNARRERIAAHARARIVFWLDSKAIEEIVEHAPDLWAWRAGVYSFHGGASEGTSAHGFPVSLPVADSSRLLSSHRDIQSAPPGTVDNRSVEERIARIAEIREWLSQEPPPPDELKSGPIGELGFLLQSVEDYDSALSHWRNVALPHFRSRANRRGETVALARIAELMVREGKLDEAKAVFRDQIIPAFEELHDAGAVAETWDRVAMILDLQGRIDDAQQIRLQHVLPIRERFGDKRGVANTLAESVSYLIHKNRLDEAFQILTERQIPAAMELGDLRDIVYAQNLLAEIKILRGEFDEALRILSDQLPVLDRLGDKTWRVLLQDRIADILEARGQYSDSLRLRRDIVLPELERTGNRLQIARAIVRMAPSLLDQGLHSEAVRLLKETALPILVSADLANERAICRTFLAMALNRGTFEERQEAEEQRVLALKDSSEHAPDLLPMLARIMNEAGLVS